MENYSAVLFTMERFLCNVRYNMEIIPQCGLHWEYFSVVWNTMRKIILQYGLQREDFSVMWDAMWKLFGTVGYIGRIFLWWGIQHGKLNCSVGYNRKIFCGVGYNGEIILQCGLQLEVFLWCGIQQGKFF